MSKYRAQEQDIDDALAQCGWHAIDSRVEKPFINKHFPSTDGEVVFADLFYPVNRIRKYPAALRTDSLTRFTAGCILDDISHDRLVGSFIRLWLSWVGAPDRLLAGEGANFPGKKWAMMSNFFGVNIAVVPVGSHHSIGRVGRHVQIIEKAFLSIDLAVGGSVSYQTKFAMALVAHNTMPNSGNNITPMFAANGRPSIIERILSAPVVPEAGDSYDTTGRDFRKRMMSIKKAHESTQKYDALETARMCLRKNLQVGSDILLRENDMVDLWVAKRSDGKEPIECFMMEGELSRWKIRGPFLNTPKSGCDCGLGQKQLQHQRMWGRNRHPVASEDQRITKNSWHAEHRLTG